MMDDAQAAGLNEGARMQITRTSTGSLRFLSALTTILAGGDRLASGLAGYESSSAWGVFAPAATPAAIVTQLNRDFVQVLEMPAIRQKFFAAGMEVIGSKPESLVAVVKTI